MLLFTRGLPVLLELGLLIYCLIDVIQSPDAAIRGLPKWGWLLFIIFLPIVGSLVWLFAGRPVPGYRPTSRPGYSPGFPEHERHIWSPGAAGAPAPTAPDDDPEFLRELDKLTSDYEHEQTLKQWEADLKRRENDLRKHNKDAPGAEE
jgi:hypothetical protein